MPDDRPKPVLPVFHTLVQRPAKDLRAGDLLDLAGDTIADPESASVSFACELAIVATIERETPECVLIYIESVGAFGFPPAHEITVVGHDSNYD